MELQELQELCRQIADENDHAKAHRMLMRLREQLHSGIDEGRMKLQVIAKQIRKMEGKNKNVA